MATAWEDSIKASKQLTVFPTESLRKSTAWGPIFKLAITEFNGLSATHKLGVTLVETATAPDPDGDGGANIQCDIGNGSAKGKAAGQEFDEPFSATEVHGLTKVFRRSFGNNPARVFKCLVFVPARPTVQPPVVKGSGRLRLVGDGVRLFVMVHELVHATGGLNNSEHSPEDIADVFLGPPQASPTVDADTDPKKDKVRVGAFPNFSRFPPLTLSARTAGLIQSSWI